jgi:hypothetical protein
MTDETAATVLLADGRVFEGAVERDGPVITLSGRERRVVMIDGAATVQWGKLTKRSWPIGACREVRWPRDEAEAVAA